MIIGAQPEYLTNLRGALIRDLLAIGHQVTAVGAFEHEGVRRKLEAWGAQYRVAPMQRAGLNPISDLGSLRALYRVVRDERPDVVFSYTIKPIVYGLPIAALAGVKRRFAMVAGRGYAFLPGKEFKRRLSRFLGAWAYRVGLAFANGVAFQNEEDRALFKDLGLIGRAKPTIRIFGSGVELDRFEQKPLSEGPPTFLMIARLLRDKGVADFAEAARIVKAQRPDARFVLVGPFDPSPNGLRPEEVGAWQKEGLVDYTGEQPDVRPYLAAAHVYVLPSRYGEGVPRSILEALATGRAVITTDSAGCRDTVEAGRNGYLAPQGDVAALAEAMLSAISDRARLAEFGQFSRRLACERFDVAEVNRSLIALMGLDA